MVTQHSFILLTVASASDCWNEFRVLSIDLGLINHDTFNGEGESKSNVAQIDLVIEVEVVEYSLLGHTWISSFNQLDKLDDCVEQHDEDNDARKDTT